MTRYLPLLSLATLLTGCGTLSGLDGSKSFACKAPAGVSCISVSGVYANNPATPPPTDPNDQTEEVGIGKSRPPSFQPTYADAKTLHAMPVNGAPLLSPPRVLRIWMAPWRDQDGDLRDQSYVYVMWDRGDWNIQHSRDQILDQYAPVSLRKQVSPSNATAPDALVLAPAQDAQSMVDKAGEKPLTPEAHDGQ